MFARLLGRGPTRAGQTARTTPLLGQPLPPRGLPKRGLQATTLNLSEAELDHLLDYWSRVPPKILTATVRIRLFTHHLTVTLETHPLYEQMRDHAVRSGLVPMENVTTLIPTLVDITLQSLHAARAPGDLRENDDRFAVGIPAFINELDEHLFYLTNPYHRDLVDDIGTNHLRDLIRDCLVHISHEYVLAKQISDTAKLIRRMEELLATAKLPDEDLYELKLRRDLFLTDLRLYNRLTRRAMGLNGANDHRARNYSPIPRRLNMTTAPPAPGLLARMFRSCGHALSGMLP